MVSGYPGPSEREVACTRADAAECARKEGAAAAVTKLCASEENQPAPSPPKAFIASAQAQPAASTAQKKTDHWKGGGTAVLVEPNQRGRGRSDPMQRSRRNSAGQLPAEEADLPVRSVPGETDVDVDLGHQAARRLSPCVDLSAGSSGPRGHPAPSRPAGGGGRPGRRPWSGPRWPCCGATSASEEEGQPEGVAR